MHPVLVPPSDPAASAAVPVLFVTPPAWRDVAGALGDAAVAFAAAQGFDASSGQSVALPDPQGRIVAVLFGADVPTPRRPADPFHASRIVQALPAGLYRLEALPGDAHLAALAVVLGSYRYSRYRDRPAKPVRIVVPDGVDGEAVTRQADAVALGRDLINTPAGDLGPAELENHARAFAAR
ncbi:MAG: leucyl aminopeptidase family protein, partial [Alsobacter sp.]